MSFDAGDRYEGVQESGLSRWVERWLLLQGLEAGASSAAPLPEPQTVRTTVLRSAEVTSFVTAVAPACLADALRAEARRLTAAAAVAPAPRPSAAAPAAVAPDAPLDQARASLTAELAAPHASVDASAELEGSLRGLRGLVFEQAWPTAHTELRELAHLPSERVRAFAAAHVAPERAVLSLVGDFEPSEALPLIRAELGRIARAAVPTAALAAPVEQNSRRTLVGQSATPNGAALSYGWPIPGQQSEAHAALEVAAEILGGGRLSRLHQDLVLGRARALGVSAGTDGLRGSDLWWLHVRLTANSAPSAIAALVDEHIGLLGRFGPSELELRAARERLCTRLLVRLEPASALGQWLGQTELGRGAEDPLGETLQRYRAVSPSDVQRAVASLLGPTHRSVVET